MRRLLLSALVLSAAACGGDPAPAGEPIFGVDDTVCPSLVLTNDADDEARARAGTACFLDAVDAGTPLVWDIDVPTVEGDPIYHRFHFTGDDVLIVRDDRADTFGNGGVRAQRCATVTSEPLEWLPVGVDCEGVTHPGFPEAG